MTNNLSWGLRVSAEISESAPEQLSVTNNLISFWIWAVCSVPEGIFPEQNWNRQKIVLPIGVSVFCSLFQNSRFERFETSLRVSTGLESAPEQLSVTNNLAEVSSEQNPEQLSVTCNLRCHESEDFCFCNRAIFWEQNGNRQKIDLPIGVSVFCNLLPISRFERFETSLRVSTEVSRVSSWAIIRDERTAIVYVRNMLQIWHEDARDRSPVPT